MQNYAWNSWVQSRYWKSKRLPFDEITMHCGSTLISDANKTRVHFYDAGFSIGTCTISLVKSMGADKMHKMIALLFTVALSIWWSMWRSFRRSNFIQNKQFILYSFTTQILFGILVWMHRYSTVHRLLTSLMNGTVKPLRLSLHYEINNKHVSAHSIYNLYGKINLLNATLIKFTHGIHRSWLSSTHRKKYMFQWLSFFHIFILSMTIDHLSYYLLHLHPCLCQMHFESHRYLSIIVRKFANLISVTGHRHTTLPGYKNCIELRPH